LVETILPGLLQAVGQDVEAANCALEFGWVRLHRGDAAAEHDGVFKPLLRDRHSAVASAVIENTQLIHLAKAGNALLR
jgi:hypothetical protein